uniref:HTH_Tnp_Tc3_1 domain-containing protein n=2 Tax=Heterorhabditis bacteriophora TaxID=37862 RepID=A0A1I7X5M2_HETBA
MGRASTLSLHERGQIKVLSTTGYTVKQIADVVKRSRKAIMNFLRHQEEYGTKKSSGRLSKLNDREKGKFCGLRRITQSASLESNLWAIPVRRIYADNRQFETVKDLQSAISKAWNELDESVIKNLVDSMPERIFQGWHSGLKWRVLGIPGFRVFEILKKPDISQSSMNLSDSILDFCINEFSFYASILCLLSYNNNYIILPSIHESNPTKKYCDRPQCISQERPPVMQMTSMDVEGSLDSFGEDSIQSENLVVLETEENQDYVKRVCYSCI